MIHWRNWQRDTLLMYRVRKAFWGRVPGGSQKNLNLMKSKVLKTLARIIAIFLVLFALANKMYMLFIWSILLLLLLIFV